MPIIGYKRRFKNLSGFENDTFIINFKLKYNKRGALRLNSVFKKNSYFDVGDFRIKIDELVERLDNDLFSTINNGVYILSVCKYLVDNIPGIYSINYECEGMIDTYYKKDIIKDYKKIKKLKNKVNLS